MGPSRRELMHSLNFARKSNQQKLFWHHFPFATPAEVGGHAAGRLELKKIILLLFGIYARS
jgi:hypothetical protein